MLAPADTTGSAAKRRCPFPEESRPQPNPQTSPQENFGLPPNVAERLNFFKAFDGLFNSPIGSDLTIIVGKVAFHAHYCILSLRTNYFNPPVIPPAQTPQNEPGPRKFALLGHGVPEVWRFLKWCYTGEYLAHHFPSLSACCTGVVDNGTLVANINVYLLASTLDIPALKMLAVMRQYQVMGQGYPGLSVVPEAVLHYFPSIARKVYGATTRKDDPMRMVMVRYAVAHHHLLMRMPPYEAMLGLCNEFSMDLMKELARRYAPQPLPPMIPLNPLPNVARPAGPGLQQYLGPIYTATPGYDPAQATMSAMWQVFSTQTDQKKVGGHTQTQSMLPPQNFHQASTLKAVPQTAPKASLQAAPPVAAHAVLQAAPQAVMHTSPDDSLSQDGIKYSPAATPKPASRNSKNGILDSQTSRETKPTVPTGAVGGYDPHGRAPSGM